jgi:hypothetical protein
MPVGLAQELSLPDRPVSDIDKHRAVQFLRGGSETISINVLQQVLMLPTEDREDGDEEWEEIEE